MKNESEVEKILTHLKAIFKSYYDDFPEENIDIYFESEKGTFEYHPE